MLTCYHPGFISCLTTEDLDEYIHTPARSRAHPVAALCSLLHSVRSSEAMFHPSSLTPSQLPGFSGEFGSQMLRMYSSLPCF